MEHARAQRVLSAALATMCRVAERCGAERWPEGASRRPVFLVGLEDVLSQLERDGLIESAALRAGEQPLSTAP